VVAASDEAAPTEVAGEHRPAVGARPRIASAWFDGRRQAVPIYERGSIGSTSALSGPALVVERSSCTVVEPGWTLRCHPSGSLLLSRDGEA
jgi:N-methylhydantoinase A/oxoprolinase/acetone carboxylase beta subunit